MHAGGLCLRLRSIKLLIRKEIEVVEAAGVEPAGASFSNLVMALSFGC
jgi:hypothetical protein